MERSIFLSVSLSLSLSLMKLYHPSHPSTCALAVLLCFSVLSFALPASLLLSLSFYQRNSMYDESRVIIITRVKSYLLKVVRLYCVIFNDVYVLLSAAFIDIFYDTSTR